MQPVDDLKAGKFAGVYLTLGSQIEALADTRLLLMYSHERDVVGKKFDAISSKENQATHNLR